MHTHKFSILMRKKKEDMKRERLKEPKRINVKN